MKRMVTKKEIGEVAVDSVQGALDSNEISLVKKVTFNITRDDFTTLNRSVGVLPISKLKLDYAHMFPLRIHGLDDDNFIVQTAEDKEIIGVELTYDSGIQYGQCSIREQTDKVTLLYFLETTTLEDVVDDLGSFSLTIYYINK